MKQLFVMLLLVSSAITTAQAQKRIYPNTPQRVINKLNLIINLEGDKERQTYSVTKNPNTNLIESSERIVHFTTDIKSAALAVLPQDFMNDEPVSYQIKHITKGNSEKFSILFVTNDKSMTKPLNIRTKSSQEMWYMACKNPENPQLRDVYAAVWEVMDSDAAKVEGTIYMITSLRPDIYEKEFDTKNTVFDDTKDDVVSDHVEDKVEIDPAEVEDEPMIIDKVEFRDNESVPGYGAQVIPVAPQLGQPSRWEPSPEVKMQVEAKATAIEANIEAIKSTYASLKPYIDMKSLTGTENYFNQITKLNKELDAKVQDLFKTLNGMEIPPTEYAERTKAMGEIYKEYLKFFTEQNQGFSMLYKEVGLLPKAAQKTQKYISVLTEKYMKEMSKAIAGMR